MKINIFPFEKIESQKTELRAKLNLPDGVRLDLAFDAVHGLNDLCRSLADLHPHKKSIAVLGAQPTPLREVIAGFAGQGFAIQELPVSLEGFDEPKLRVAWDALKRDTLFVLTSAVEPFTGAVYPFEWIRKEGPKKNIFSLIYMSPDALLRGMIVPATPFEGVIIDPLWGDEHSLVAVLRGERCQGDRLLWGEPHFSDEALSRLEERLLMSNASGSQESKRLDQVNEDMESVKNFEETIKDKVGFSIKLIGPQCRRYYDRGVLFVEGVNGEALVHGLQQDGFETFTAAACAWKNPHLNAWLSKLGLAPEMVESTLIIPLKTIKEPQFEKTLLSRIKEFQAISGGIAAAGG